MSRRRNRYEMNYARLERLIERPPTELEMETVLRLKASGFMDLVVEVLPPCERTGLSVISLVHYFEQNGDLCQDPEMAVRVIPPGSTALLRSVHSTDRKHGRLEALTYQTALPPIYHEAYFDDGDYDINRRRSLNNFLSTWLMNLEKQGHQVYEAKE